MSSSTWERLAAATGIVYVGLLLVTYFLVPRPPAPGANPDVAKLYYLDNRTAILLEGYLRGIAGILLIWFAGALRSILRGDEATGRLSAVAFGSALVFVAISYVSALFNIALAFRLANEGVPVLTSIFELRAIAESFAWIPAAGFTAAASLVMIRTAALSRAWGWLGVLVTVVLTAGGARFLSSDGLFSPMSVLDDVTFWTFLGWVLITGILAVGAAGMSGEETPA